MIIIIKCDWPKSYDCRKTLQNWLKMLFIAPLYNLEKNLLVKCICYKKSMKNQRHEKLATFLLKTCPFLDDNRFLFNTEMSNIKSWNFQVSYLVCCYFFMSWNFGDRKYIKDIFSISFSSNNWKRRYIYFEGLYAGL